MKHKIALNRLGRTSTHRRAMMRNAINSLILRERLRTTKAKAREVQRVVEKMITRAATNSVHNWRHIHNYLQDKQTVAKLMNVIGPRFAARSGGYTRILSIGNRRGDNAEMVLFELVERSAPPPKKERVKRGKKSTENNTSTSSRRTSSSKSTSSGKK